MTIPWLVDALHIGKGGGLEKVGTPLSQFLLSPDTRTHWLLPNGKWWTDPKEPPSQIDLNWEAQNGPQYPKVAPEIDALIDEVKNGSLRIRFIFHCNEQTRQLVNMEISQVASNTRLVMEYLLVPSLNHYLALICAAG